jgi:YD repeat-containing protein
MAIRPERSEGPLSPRTLSPPTESISYTNRGQLQNLTVTAQSTTIYSLGMTYTPNGNVASANDSVNGNWTYSYDEMNRVIGASKNSGQQTYNYVYDRYGNRWQQNAPQGGNVQLLTFSVGNNNRMDGYTYDAAGNQTSDGINTLTYDVENRIHTATNAGVVTTYVYDAFGRRIRKTVGSTSTDYIYNLSGNAVAEVNGSGTWTRGEVFVGGKHVATYASGVSGTTYFAHVDWLGTERVHSNVSGAACETVTSLIFGDGMATSGSCGDPSTRHFTGKERDAERRVAQALRLSSLSHKNYWVPRVAYPFQGLHLSLKKNDRVPHPLRLNLAGAFPARFGEAQRVGV